MSWAGWAQVAALVLVQLLQAVWGPQYEKETNYLRVYLAQIRKKLEPDPPARATSSPRQGWDIASRPRCRAPRCCEHG